MTDASAPVSVHPVQPEDIERVGRGRVAENLLEFIAERTQSRSQGVIRRVFHVLDSREPLPPDVAIQAWIELHQIDKVNADLRKLAKQGRNAAGKVAPGM